LRVPDDLQIQEFESVLGLQVHRTGHTSHIFMAGQRLIDVPAHWEGEVFRRANTGGKRSRFAVASLPGAQEKVIRLPMHNPNMLTLVSDITVRDIGNIVVGLDQLSVHQEMQARLPMLRRHPGMLCIALLLGLAAGLCAMFRDQELGASTSQRQALQQDVKRLTARYLKGVPVDVAALQARGFQQLELMPDTQGKVVTAASFKGL